MIPKTKILKGGLRKFFIRKFLNNAGHETIAAVIGNYQEEFSYDSSGKSICRFLTKKIGNKHKDTKRALSLNKKLKSLVSEFSIDLTISDCFKQINLAFEFCDHYAYLEKDDKNHWKTSRRKEGLKNQKNSLKKLKILADTFQRLYEEASNGVINVKNNAKQIASLEKELKELKDKHTKKSEQI